jgi:hypothetical protein
MFKPVFAPAAALFATAAALTPPACAQTPQPGQVVDAVYQAYGGRDLLSGVQALRLEGTVVTAMGGQRGRFIRIVEGHESLKVLLHYPDHVEIRLVDGQKGWNGNTPQSLHAASGAMLAAMQLQASRSWVPWILGKMRDSLRVERADTGVVVMAGGLAPGLALRFWVDAHTHRVLRTESDMDAGGMKMTFATDYGDFRKVSGVLVAFHEENFAAGQHTASMEADTVSINPPADRRKLPMGPSGG